jgi:urease accessory protein
MSSWLVLQLADSAFPTGGFAHSGGLEAAVHLGEVTQASLQAHVRQMVWQAGLAALPLVHAGAEAPERLVELDKTCHAFLTSHIANRASRTQGRAFVSTCARIFEISELLRLDQAVRARTIHGHLAPVFGAALRALEVPVLDAERLFLHQTLRSATSAAVRLGLVGPHEAQRLQRDLGPLAEEVLMACRELSVDSLAQPAPLLDLFGTLHDGLYARLFQS